MAGETQITLVGNVIADPEMRFTPSGAAVCNFRMASTPRTFDKQSNEWKDAEPLFLTVNVWRQQAEQVAESVAKGTRVVVVGSLKSRSYEKDGQKRTVFEVEAEDVAVSLKFATAKVTKAQGGGGQRQQGGGQQQGGGWGSQPPQQQQRQPQGAGSGWGAPQSQGQQGGGGFSEQPPF